MAKLCIILLIGMSGCVTVVGNGLGEQCAGLAGLTCKDGLTCRPDDPSVIDGFGKCVEN